MLLAIQLIYTLNYQLSIPYSLRRPNPATASTGFAHHLQIQQH